MLKFKPACHFQRHKYIFQVLWELTQGKLGEAPAPPVATENTPIPTTSHVRDKEEEEDLDEMQSRLEALRS